MHDVETPDAYLNRAQEYADALIAIGEPVKDKDLIMLAVSVGSRSMSEARQAQLSELTTQLSALGFQVSPIVPSGPQAFYGVRPSNNRNNNNNNHGNRNNSGGNNNQGRDNGRQFDWASIQNTMYGTCNRCDTGANSHVTPDLEAMENSEAYYGDDALHVGNVPCAFNTNVVDGKWVYKLKQNKNGAITRYKARFVAKGFQQQPRIDFHEIFSSVVKSTTIRAFLSLAVTNDWPLRQLDTQNAFFMKMLRSSLNQAPHTWFERLSKALFDLGFKGSKTDPSLFIYLRGYTLLYILVYVDDIIVTGNLDTSLEAISDVDWAEDSDDRQFTRGFSIYLGSNLISWTARKQHTVLCSSAEAEYKVLVDTIAELTWLQALLNELGICSSSTPILCCDNLGVTYMSANPIFHARTKHMEIDYHFIQEKVSQGDL
nr:hypothetical protein [Tanacetum cinerariifolium]